MEKIALARFARGVLSKEVELTFQLDDVKMMKRRQT